MSGLRTFALSAWDFVVGDDWRTAVGVVAAIGATALLAGASAAAWLVLPLAVTALLAASLRRAARASAPSPPPGEATTGVSPRRRR
jgi:hypothetical protein